MPDNITKMLRQYKKTAYINSVKSPICKPGNNKVKIGTIDFTATKIFAIAKPLGADGGEFAESMYRLPISSNLDYKFENGTTYTLRLTCENKDLYLVANGMAYVGSGRIFQLTEIVAVE